MKTNGLEDERVLVIGSIGRRVTSTVTPSY